MKILERLVGRWSTEGAHRLLPGAVIRGTMEVEWLEGTAFLLIRTRTDHPDIPDATSILGMMDVDRAHGVDAAVAAPATGLVMHYYDTRGVFRAFHATLDDRAWRLRRDAPGFSQRFVGTFADGDRTIQGQWQLCRDDKHWEDDMQVTYRLLH